MARLPEPRVGGGEQGTFLVPPAHGAPAALGQASLQRAASLDFGVLETLLPVQGQAQVPHCLCV